MNKLDEIDSKRGDAMKRRTVLLLMALPVLFSGCYQGYVKFKPPEPEFVQTPFLEEFMKKHKSPKVVLRVPDSELIIPQAEKHNLLYAAIEEEMIKAGFQVSDRALFKEILRRSDENMDYVEMSRRTQTDMILELVKLDTDVSYETNRYYTYEGEKKLFPQNESLKACGAKVTFRIILIEENKLAGSFTFHYAPCQDGCAAGVSPSGAYLKKEAPSFQDISYQTVEIDELEEFVKSAARQLIIHLESLRN